VKILNKKSVVKCFFFLLSLILSHAYAGQVNIRFQRIALEQGLSQETILSSYQDIDGFMWFGTQEGLNRYDGYQFKVFSHSPRNSNSLSSDWIYAINEADDGQLWLGTMEGVNIYNKSTQTFTHLKHDPTLSTSLSQNNVRVLFRDSSNIMWVGTHDGLNRYNSNTGEFTRFYSDASKNKQGLDKISAIIEDQLGFIWVSTDGNGLYKLDPNSGEIILTSKKEKEKEKEKIGFLSPNIRSLFLDSMQRLWIGSAGDGLSVISLSHSPSENDVDLNWLPEKFAGLVISNIYEDNVGAIWIGTEVGLYRYDSHTKTFQTITHEADNVYSLSTNQITHLYQDNGGVFWVGTFNGLNKWNTATAKFDHLRVNSDLPGSLSNNFIHSFYDDGNGHVWIATFKGLNLLNTASGEVKIFLHDSRDINSLRSNKVMSLFTSNPDELWIGYRDKGLSLLNRKTGEFTHYVNNPNDPSSLGANGVTSIKQAKNGKLWVGVFGGGVNLFDPSTDKFTRYTHQAYDLQSLSSNKVLSIFESSDGLLWLGTAHAGINIFNPITSTSIRIVHQPEILSSLGSNVIWAIQEDSQKNIWVGTQGAGLNKLSAENRLKGEYRFEKITREEGLPSNAVYGIIEDSAGFLWVSTNRGLTKYNPETKQLVNYDSSHGLQGNEFNSGAYYKSQDGKLFFGGTNGVTAFYPEDISASSFVPPVVLTQFQKLNEVMSIDSVISRSNNIQISYMDYLIAFEFAVLDYASPNNYRYQYRLEGFDQEWIDAGDVRKATYTNLPSGDFVFEVKAFYNGVLWNEQGTTVALTVFPAPWYSWWAYLIYSLLLLGILYQIYRFYVNKFEEESNYSKKLEVEVESRTAELTNANELLLNASITDQLTGLNNRRYLNSIVKQRCSSVLREFEALGNPKSGPRLFFLMFDLDGFKPINDNYGHDSGDKVIVQVGNVLKSVCRTSDTVIRWGGDEFLVMGRVDDMREVEVLAERLRSDISANGFDIDIKDKIYLSCSIGYSLYPFSHHYPNILSWEQVQLLADNALYKSKQAGRNKWTGILQTAQKPPVSVMGTLTKNIELVIEANYAQVKQST
jgi:diguanylate cyclase (GGDEF)-like protein